LELKIKDDSDSIFAQASLFFYLGIDWCQLSQETNVSEITYWITTNNAELDVLEFSSFISQSVWESTHNLRLKFLKYQNFNYSLFFSLKYVIKIVNFYLWQTTKSRTMQIEILDRRTSLFLKTDQWRFCDFLVTFLTKVSEWSKNKHHTFIFCKHHFIFYKGGVPRKFPPGGASVAKTDNKLWPLGSRLKITFIDILEGQIFMIHKYLQLWMALGSLNLWDYERL